MHNILENKTFDEIQIGDRASLTQALSQEGVEALAIITGNLNLIDLDPGPVDTSMFGQGGGQTGWSAALFATLAGTRLPGLGSIARHIDVRLHRPVAIGVPITATATVVEKRADTGTVVLECRAVDPAGAEVASGQVEVLAPTVKIRQEVANLPTVQFPTGLVRGRGAVRGGPAAGRRTRQGRGITLLPPAPFDKAEWPVFPAFYE